MVQQKVVFLLLLAAFYFRLCQVIYYFFTYCKAITLHFVRYFVRSDIHNVL